jgi:hypothetical protein
LLYIAEMSITKLLPAVPIPTIADADAFLELAFLMTAADGELRGDELRAFRDVVERVRGEKPTDASFDALVKRFSGTVGKAAIEARVRAIGPKIPSDLREAAFRVTVGLALVDKDGAAEEDALVSVLVAALSLPLARAEALAAEVREAFGVE